jgi:hypothetical protein
MHFSQGLPSSQLTAAHDIICRLLFLPDWSPHSIGEDSMDLRSRASPDLHSSSAEITMMMEL